MAQAEAERLRRLVDENEAQRKRLPWKEYLKKFWDAESGNWNRGYTPKEESRLSRYEFLAKPPDKFACLHDGILERYYGTKEEREKAKANGGLRGWRGNIRSGYCWGEPLRTSWKHRPTKITHWDGTRIGTIVSWGSYFTSNMGEYRFYLMAEAVNGRVYEGWGFLGGDYDQEHACLRWIGTHREEQRRIRAAKDFARRCREKEAA